MEMNENDLGKVAGGATVETKEGKWILMPPNAPTFDTKEAAEKAEKEFMGKRPPNGHGPFHGGKHGGKHGGFMPPMGEPRMGQREGGPEGPDHE